MDAAELIGVLARHLTRLGEADDIAGTDAVLAVLAELPECIRDEVDALTA